VTVGAGGNSSVEFTSIPQTYKHLQIRALTRDGQAGTEFNNSLMRFNSDSGSNYASHSIGSNGSAGFGTGYANLSSINLGLYSAASGNVSGLFASSVIDIFDYSDTTKFKTTRTLTGGDGNGFGIITLTSGLWRSTSAITSIQSPSATYAQNSQFGLFGIKGV
jgi:hypothetical protein